MIFWNLNANSWTFKMLLSPKVMFWPWIFKIAKLSFSPLFPSSFQSADPIRVLFLPRKELDSREQKGSSVQNTKFSLPSPPRKMQKCPELGPPTLVARFCKTCFDWMLANISRRQMWTSVWQIFTCWYAAYNDWWEMSVCGGDAIQGEYVGFNTGNGEKLSYSQGDPAVWLLLSLSPFLVLNPT